MALINFEHPQTLQALVTRVAEVKLKIAEVRRRKDKNYEGPNVPVSAGVAVCHMNMLDQIVECVGLDDDLGTLLVPVPNSVGRFSSGEGMLDKRTAELRGTCHFRSLFETLIMLDQLIERINVLFDLGDRERAEEEQRSFEAYMDAEDRRMEASRTCGRGRD